MLDGCLRITDQTVCVKSQFTLHAINQLFLLLFLYFTAGGAPELATEFKFLAKGGRDLGRDVIGRCNLTALLEPGHEKTAEFLAENNIIVVASLPCYRY